MDFADAGNANSGVDFDVADGIARIVLNRPHRLNAVDVAMANRLTELWRRVDGDDDVRAVIVDAADCGTFCAGMDLKDMASIRASGDDPLTRMTDPFQTRMRTVSKPVICALVGNFLGAGMLIAMGADIRVGLAGTTGSISEARFGRGTSWAVPLLWMLPQAVLSEMVMTGDPFPVETLERHGFINHVEDTVTEVRAKAMLLARRIAGNAPLSVRAAKASLAAGMDLGCAEGLARAAELHQPVYASKDATEGAAAFTEKRAPRWTGA